MRALSLFTLSLALVVTAGCNRGTTDAPAPAPAPVPGGETSGKPVPGGTTPAPTVPTTPTAPAPGGSGQTQNFSGTLAGGDAQLTSGEFADSYTVQVQAGQSIVVDMSSTAFDPYIILKAPSGSQEENDDYNGSRTRARLESVAAESGAYTVIATSYASGESGDYTVMVTTGGAAAGGGSAPAPAGGGK